MEKYKDLFMPGAILGAGILIALSVFATGGVNFPVRQDLPAQAANQPPQLSAEVYKTIAQEIGVNVDEFNGCVADRRYREKVESDYQEGIALGISGTPGTFVNGTLVAGAVPYGQLKSVIDGVLAGETSSLPESLRITERDHIRGNPNAQITLIEFSDFQCPFCRRFHATVQQAMDEYSEQVRWAYRHFPLDQIHPQARPAAEASECVAEQKGSEGFWQFADAVFTFQEG